MVKEGIAEEVALEPRSGNRRTYLKNGVEGKERACVKTILQERIWCKGQRKVSVARTHGAGEVGRASQVKGRISAFL